MKNNYEIIGNSVVILLNGLGEIHRTKIDFECFELADSFKGKWYARYNPSTNSYYAAGSYKINGKTKTLQLHRLLTSAPNNMCVDHRNHDTLDNRSENLRVVSNLINTQNKKIIKKSNKTSGIKNVSWSNFYKKWLVRVVREGRSNHIGYFNDLEEAKSAAERARFEILGIA